jgi:hypothetical protein
MAGLPSGTRVWVVTGHTDMRKGFDGLAAVAQTARWPTRSAAISLSSRLARRQSRGAAVGQPDPDAAGQEIGRPSYAPCEVDLAEAISRMMSFVNRR